MQYIDTLQYTQKYIEARDSLLNNVKNIYKGRAEIIKGFKEEIFPLISDSKLEQQTSKTNVNAFNEWINKEETSINRELFKNYFNFQRPNSMAQYLYKTNEKRKTIN